MVTFESGRLVPNQSRFSLNVTIQPHLNRGLPMPNHLIDGYYVALPETTILSKEWISLTPTTRCMYTTMLTRYDRQGANANGRVTWSQAELAKVTGISLRTIKTCIDELLDKGWMTIWEPGGRWLDGTTYEISSIYADGKDPKPTKLETQKVKKG